MGKSKRGYARLHPGDCQQIDIATRATRLNATSVYRTAVRQFNRNLGFTVEATTEAETILRGMVECCREQGAHLEGLDEAEELLERLAARRVN